MINKDTALKRVGLIVPSSNVTVEAEIPELLVRSNVARFSFHGSRMRMREVSVRGLAAMNAQRERCVIEVGDAGVDIVLYACLVAIMAAGPGEHRRVESLIAEQLATGSSDAKVRSSAGALVEALRALNAHRIAVVMPYVPSLAAKVLGYLDEEGFDVAGHRALGVENNADVACIPGDQIMQAAAELDLAGVDALVLSACVQMPSLDLIADAEQKFGLPVLSAATAGAYSVLKSLGLPTAVPDAGRLLQGDLYGERNQT